MRNTKKRGAFAESLRSLASLTALKCVLMDMLLVVSVMLVFFICSSIWSNLSAGMQDMMPSLMDISQANADQRMELVADLGRVAVSDMKSTAHWFIFTTAVIFIAWIATSIFAIAFFNSKAWSMINKTKMTWRAFWQFSGISAAIIICGWVILTLLLLVMQETVGLVISLILMVVLFNFYHLSCCLNDPKKRFWPGFISSVGSIRRKLGKYLLAVIIMAACYFLVIILLGLVGKLLPVLAFLLYLLLVLAYVTWTRMYFNIISKGDSG